MPGPPPGTPQNVRRQCKFIIKATGKRCKKHAMTGLDVCNTPSHGSGLPAVQAKHRQAKVAASLVRAGYGHATVDPEHEGASPVTGYLWELRRTAGKIVFVEEMLGKLNDKDIVWGRTLEERKDAEDNFTAGGVSNDSYDIQRDEARINLWVQIGLKERQHYATLLKLGIAAGFEERRLRLEEEVVLQLNSAIANIASRLGHDPADPYVRQVVREELLAASEESAA